MYIILIFKWKASKHDILCFCSGGEDMKKFLLFWYVFFMAVNMGSCYAMCKCTVWWMSVNILEEPVTSIILQNFGSCPPYCTALHRKTRILEFLPCWGF